MTKMSKAQQENIRAAHVNTYGNGRQVATTGNGRRYLLANGWMHSNMRPTTAGLIAAGIDMDAIHAEAIIEDAQRSSAHVRNNCPALPVGGCMQCTAPATVRAALGDDSAYHVLDTLHGEALTEDFRRRVIALRRNPELARGTLGGVELAQAAIADLIERHHAMAIVENALREAEAWAGQAIL